jgi:hypothetical protein
MLSRVLQSGEKNRSFELRLHNENNVKKLENGYGRHERMTWNG